MGSMVSLLRRSYAGLIHWVLAHPVAGAVALTLVVTLPTIFQPYSNTMVARAVGNLGLARCLK